MKNFFLLLIILTTVSPLYAMDYKEANGFLNGRWKMAGVFPPSNSFQYGTFISCNNIGDCDIVYPSSLQGKRYLERSQGSSGNNFYMAYNHYDNNGNLKIGNVGVMITKTSNNSFVMTIQDYDKKNKQLRFERK